ncbi:hypothetical protein [Phocaeicola oris]|uniref:hypothetical protein n=1 Tax=Phocaeicola oris TaxID=2896850 RepID=UPI00234F3D3E|nr:hypothetical protein [Phocaeicola oris]MCE2615727.1 hypothetical protein [Phocaeicola oris]
MKKTLGTLMACTALLCSCSSEEEVTRQTDEQYRFEVNITTEQAAGAAETRAVKQTFVNGDVVWVGFKDNMNGVLKLTYDGTEWTPSCTGTLTNDQIVTADEKRCAAVWIDGVTTEPKIPSWGKDFFVWDSIPVPDILVASEQPYTVDDKTKTIRLNLTLGINSSIVKITVTGLAKGTWKLSEQDMLNKLFPCINTNYLSVSYAGSGDYGDTITGHPASDGYYFIGSVKIGGVPNPTFTLTNGTDTYTKTFTGKTLKWKSAIKIAGPTKSDLKGWTKE